MSRHSLRRALGAAAFLCITLLVQAAPDAQPYPHAAEPIGSLRQSYDGALPPTLAVNTFRNFDRLFPA